MTTPTFPFTAIVGHKPLKLALILNTIDLAIGGVLITGPRGTGKSTIARALADLMHQAPFVNVPLSVTEDKLTGTLNLEKILKDQETHFEPGLIAKAHNGVLYVDEVNLLSDYLVDQLLDVAASGVNHVERDSVSHTHPARFCLIGTMNPEEGELRPQLLDRFGLCAEVRNPEDADSRLIMTRQNRHFAQDAAAFNEAQQAYLITLMTMIDRAKERYPSVILDEEAERSIAERCQQAGVDGIRADLIMSRAASAYAALIGKESVDDACIEEVAPLVLIHRAKNPPVPNEDNSQGQSSPEEDVTNTPQNSGTDGGEANRLVSILEGKTSEDTASKKS